MAVEYCIVTTVDFIATYSRLRGVNDGKADDRVPDETVAGRSPFFGAVAPSVEAIECVSQYYGSSYCTQCYVDSPYGWVPVGETTWVTSSCCG